MRKPSKDQITASIFMLIVVVIVFIMSMCASNKKHADIDKTKYLPKDTIIVIQDKPFYTNVQSTNKCNKRV